MEHKLSLSWEAYQKSICNGLSLLQQRGEFVDMTLAADGHRVKVHQMVLSLVSPFIKDLITSANCPHPIIFLNKVSYDILQAILEYAYTGEVMVPREKLGSFLETCKELHIKGLEGDNVQLKGDDSDLLHLIGAKGGEDPEYPETPGGKLPVRVAFKHRKASRPEVQNIEIGQDEYTHDDSYQMEEQEMDNVEELILPEHEVEESDSTHKLSNTKAIQQSGAKPSDTMDDLARARSNTRCKASPAQLVYLAKHMKNHPSMASGLTQNLIKRAELDKSWNALAAKLNSIGGPIKTVSKWKQAWRDLRNNLKKKAALKNQLRRYGPLCMETRLPALKQSTQTEEHELSIMDPLAVCAVDDDIDTTEPMDEQEAPDHETPSDEPEKECGSVLMQPGPSIKVECVSSPPPSPSPPSPPSPTAASSHGRTRKRFVTNQDTFYNRLLQIEKEKLVIKRERNSIAQEKNIILNSVACVPGPLVQYSLSCQGQVQLILNRYIYCMRHLRKNNERMWRCVDYKPSGCNATAVTKDDVVTFRGRAHNHPFHDRQILKRVHNNNIYTAFKTVHHLSMFSKRAISAEKKKVEKSTTIEKPAAPPTTSL